jgi:hypothetical protein
MLLITPPLILLLVWGMGFKGNDEFPFFTPFRIEDAQYATPSSLITAHKVGVLNEKRCKSELFILYFYKKHKT